MLMVAGCGATDRRPTACTARGCQVVVAAALLATTMMARAAEPGALAEDIAVDHASSEPWRTSAVYSHSALRRCSGVIRSFQSTTSWEKSSSVARQLPRSQRA